MESSYLLRSGHAGSSPYEVEVTPESAGWGYSSLKIISLESTGSHRFNTGSDEVIVLPLSGSVSVQAGDVRCELDGRSSVFEGPTDAAYVGLGQEVSLQSDPAAGSLFAARVPDPPSRRATSRLQRCRLSYAVPASPAVRYGTSALPDHWTLPRSSPVR